MANIMSHQAVKWAFRQDLKQGAKLVLIVLAEHADSSGYAFPGRRLIMREASVSSRSLPRAMRVLIEERKLVRAEQRLIAGRLRDGYVLLADPADLRMPATRRKPSAGDAASGGATAANLAHRTDGVRRQSGRRSEPNWRAHIKNEPPLEPSKEKAPSADVGRRPGDAFDMFWSVYPHPAGDPMKPARDQWLEALRTGADPDQVIAAARAYATSLRARENRWQACAQAKTWLKEERWRDWAPRSTVDAPDPREPSVETGEPVAGLWRQTWNRLRSERPDVFQAWVARLVLVGMEGDDLTLRAPTRFHATWVSQNLADWIGRTAGRRVRIVPPGDPDGRPER